MTREIPDGPTHWAYPERFRDWFSDGKNCALVVGVYEEIELALEHVDGEIVPGFDGWGVSFATPEDKVLFFLKFDWSKFA
jgi:hypothetical protein